jgi:hypothetical protein
VAGRAQAGDALAQLSDHKLVEAIDANCQTKICFALQAADAKRMAAHYAPRLDAYDLQHLGRATEAARRVKAKLDAYKHALVADPHRDRGNILLVCEGKRRLANLARCAPPGPPWIWGSTDGERYELLPAREQKRHFTELPAAPRTARRHVDDCLGRRWRRPALNNAPMGRWAA